MILFKKINFHLYSILIQVVCFSLLVLSCNIPPVSNAEIKKTGDSTNTSTPIATTPEKPSWIAPDTTTIPHDKTGNLIRYGRELVANTAVYLGPKGKVAHLSNGMNCQNCHLDAGTRLLANSYSAVYSIYPKFRPRSGTVENLEKRINDCMERSLNGTKLDSSSHEMRALVAYINWVGKDVEKGVSPKGVSVVDVPYLNRAADTTLGKIAYKKSCIICHGSHGQGIMKGDGISYLYPPLWGPDSYNTAAGMYRLSRLAGYIKTNMPDALGDKSKPLLTDEESWDIAAYINSLPHPEKKFEKDWPDISKKPVDLPFGPYADAFSETQHKYGPYKEMTAGLTKH